MKYGSIEDIVLLGGGELLRHICLWATSESTPIKVVTAPRQAEEVLEGESLEEFLSRHEISYLVVEKISDESTKKFIGDTSKSFCLSLGAAWIFKAKIISSYFDNKLFNLHGRRLPQNRGGGGFSWEIMMGNKFGFGILHLVDEGVDTGDIVSFDEFLYPPTCRKPIDYEKIYVEKNVNFVIDFIEKYRSSSLDLNVIAQCEYLSTYWPRLNTNLNGWIDWSMDSIDVERFICAFDEPYVGASTNLNGDIVRIKSVCLSQQDGFFNHFQTGLIYRKTKKWLCVCLRESTLIVEEIYDESGENIFDKVKVGDRFVTPIGILDSAKSRPIYTPKGLK